MKSFEQCYDIFEGSSVDVWRDTTGPGARMRFRNTEFYADKSVTLETFIDTLKTNWLCYVLFDELDTCEEYCKCIKRLHKLCPELFNGTLSYKDIMDSIKPYVWKAGLIIRKGSIAETIYKGNVVEYMHHAWDDRKAYSVKLK